MNNYKLKERETTIISQWHDVHLWLLCHHRSRISCRLLSYGMDHFVHFIDDFIFPDDVSSQCHNFSFDVIQNTCYNIQNCRIIYYWHYDKSYIILAINVVNNHILVIIKREHQIMLRLMEKGKKQKEEMNKGGQVE